jgi:cyclohexyl-isocyanide hydratase
MTSTSSGAIMSVQRRTLLGGLGAAALTPFFAVQQAMATAPPHKANDPSQDEMVAAHARQMGAVYGDGLLGSEEIAMLMYPGFTALDLVGPHYFFACMFGAKVHLVTTERDLRPVASDLGLAIAPTTRMANVPKKVDVLFVPGGLAGTLATMERPDVMRFLTSRATDARHVTSVCTGSMVLAKAGLLKGKRATSHWATRPILADFGAIPVDARVVKDGKYVTGAGVSAGLDYAIALVEMLRGRAYAESLVLQAEYAPEPPIRGGTLATTSKPVADVMTEMLMESQAKFRALAR